QGDAGLGDGLLEDLVRQVHGAHVSSKHLERFLTFPARSVCGIPQWFVHRHGSFRGVPTTVFAPEASARTVDDMTQIADRPATSTTATTSSAPTIDPAWLGE